VGIGVPLRAGREDDEAAEAAASGPADRREADVRKPPMLPQHRPSLKKPPLPVRGAVCVYLCIHGQLGCHYELSAAHIRALRNRGFPQEQGLLLDLPEI